MTVSAHFDGKVIVPDEPLDLPPNQALILQIQAVGALFSFLSASYSGVLWAIGRPGLGTALLAVQVAVVATLTLVGHALGGTLGLVVGASCTGLAMYPFNAALYSRFGLFQPRTDWAPIAAGLVCAFYVARFGGWHAIAH